MRKHKLLIVCILCIFYTALFPVSLHAIDLTLHVPVELVNLPANITDGKVECSAFTASRISNTFYAPALATDAKFFAISGNYTATVDIVLKAPGNNPPSGLGWRCFLFLRDANNRESGGVQWQPASRVMAGYAGIVDSSKPVRYEVSGIK